MNATRTILAVVSFVGLTSCTTIPPKGAIYYTKVNVWYTNPKDIRTTNYHQGVMIPFGTKVTIDSIHHDWMGFTTADQISFKLLLSHSVISMEENFDRYFTVDDPLKSGGMYDGFTEMEKENLKIGNIAIGMGKSAVLASYGFPPSHVTPDLNSDFWRYWMISRDVVDLCFTDGKVSDIKKVSVKGPPPGIKTYTSVSSLSECRETKR